MNKKYYNLLIIILLSIIFVRSFIVLNKHFCENKDDDTNKQQVPKSVVLPPVTNNNSVPRINAKDFRELDTLFYEHLKNCNPVIIDTNTGLSYRILGLGMDGICSFERNIDSHTTRCNLPMDIAKQYSKAGLSIMLKLEENIKQNKIVYTDKELQSSYMNSIDSDSQYCNPPTAPLPSLDEPVRIDTGNSLPKK